MSKHLYFLGLIICIAIILVTFIVAVQGIVSGTNSFDLSSMFKMDTQLNKEKEQEHQQENTTNTSNQKTNLSKSIISRLDLIEQWYLSCDQSSNRYTDTINHITKPLLLDFILVHPDICLDSYSKIAMNTALLQPNRVRGILALKYLALIGHKGPYSVLFKLIYDKDPIISRYAIDSIAVYSDIKLQEFYIEALLKDGSESKQDHYHDNGFSKLFKHYLNEPWITVPFHVKDPGLINPFCPISYRDKFNYSALWALTEFDEYTESVKYLVIRNSVPDYIKNAILNSNGSKKHKDRKIMSEEFRNSIEEIRIGPAIDKNSVISITNLRGNIVKYNLIELIPEIEKKLVEIRGNDFKKITEWYYTKSNAIDNYQKREFEQILFYAKELLLALHNLGVTLSKDDNEFLTKLGWIGDSKERLRKAGWLEGLE